MGCHNSHVREHTMSSLPEFRWNRLLRWAANLLLKLCVNLRRTLLPDEDPKIPAIVQSVSNAWKALKLCCLPGLLHNWLFLI